MLVIEAQLAIGRTGGEPSVGGEGDPFDRAGIPSIVARRLALGEIDQQQAAMALEAHGEVTAIRREGERRDRLGKAADAAAHLPGAAVEDVERRGAAAASAAGHDGVLRSRYGLERALIALAGRRAPYRPRGAVRPPTTPPGPVVCGRGQRAARIGD